MLSTFIHFFAVKHYHSLNFLDVFKEALINLLLNFASIFSAATNYPDADVPKTPLQDSRSTVNRRISSFSAITNESAFLNKFYSKVEYFNLYISVKSKYC